MPRDEREFGRLVGESGGALVANERGLLPQQQQVEIAIVVVIDPQSFFILSCRQLRGMLLENAVAIVIERRAGICEHTKVGQAIVVEVSGRDGLDVFQSIEAALGDWRLAALVNPYALRRPRDQIRSAVAIEIHNREARRRRVEVTRQLAIGKLQRRWRSTGRLRLDRFIDLGVVAPLHVLGHSGAGLAFLDLLKNFQLIRSLFTAARLPILIEELEVRTSQVGIQLGRNLQLLEPFAGLACQLVQHTEVVVRHRLVGHQFGHLLKLLDGVLVVAVFLVDNSQVEPGVWNFWVLLLGFEQLSHAVLGLAGAQQGDAIVHPLTRGIGRHIERFLEFNDGFLLRCGVLVEGFAEIAMAPK